MTYRHYTKEYRRQIVDKFHNSGMKIHSYVKTVNVSARTLYVWLEEDGRPFKQQKERSKTYCKFSFDVKIHAIQQVLQYKRRACEVAPEFGVTFAMLYRWLKIYQEKGEYVLMSEKDIKDGNISNEARLKAENEKLKHQNLKLQMRIDAYEMAQKLLKNFPALSWSESLQDLTNPVKIELIERLGAKFEYKLNALLDIFDIKESSYHTGKNGVKRTKPWQTKSMKKHNSYKNDGNPPVKNWLYDSKAGVHFFKPKKLWEILGTDVTEIM